MSSGCAGPPSPTCPVCCHSPALSSPPRRLAGGSLMYALVQPTSFSFQSRRHLSVLSVLSPVSVWSPQCRPGRSCGGYNIPHWVAYPEVLYPCPWSSLSRESTVMRLRCHGVQEVEKETLVMVLYEARMSGDIRQICRKFNI